MSERSAPLPEGALIASRYRVRSTLGAGGMGAVYRVFDELVGEEVALKVLAEANRGATDRFRAEARLARRITHRNVGRTYDIGSDQALLFITMELVDGCTVLDWIRRGPSPDTSVAWLISEVAAGLVAAHGADVVHRDLKPSNLLVTRDDRVIVIDWGVATIRDAAGQGVAGTPDYMAPEQLRGQAPAPPQDIYSLGLVMFELLTGQRAFSGATAADRASARLDRDPALSLLPAESKLRSIVGRCLASDPGARPSAAELRHSLLALGPWAPAPAARQLSGMPLEAPTRVEPSQGSPLDALQHTAMMAYLTGATVFRSPARQWPAAYEAFRKCVELEPGFLPSVAACALAAAYVGTYSNQTEHSAEELASAVTAARERAPHLADTQVALALLSLRESRYPQGIRCLNEALKIDPRHARAHEHLGRIECETGFAEQGARRIFLAILLDPALRGALSLVGRAHALRGRVDLFDEALAFGASVGTPSFEEAMIEARVACWWQSAARAEALLSRLQAIDIGSSLPYRIAAGIARVTLDHGELWDLRQLLRSVPLAPRIAMARLQVSAEVEGAVGDPLLAISLLERADQAGLIDIEWLAHCPALDLIREQSRFERVLESVHARARALWPDPTPPLPSLA